LSNKEKILASAQKNLQKGQIPKAIKDFRKLVEIEPKDMRHKQKLADLYSRAKMAKDAFEQYDGVARFYADNGFYLKAIAVYKQMQKLDPSRVELYHRLAELNQKQGLVGNALAEYRNLVGYYENNRMYPEALDTLEKMKEIEPENLNLRVKIAETYVRAEKKEKGLQEFRDILLILRNKNDFAKQFKLYEFFVPLFPDNAEIRIGLACALIEKGEFKKGITQLKGMQKDHPENPALIKGLAQGFKKAGEHESARLAYKHLLKLAPDDLASREGFLTASLAAGKPTEVLARLEHWGDDLIAAERIDLVKALYEQLHEILPEDDRIPEALQGIYQITGEGGKLLDIMVSDGGRPEVSGPVADTSEELSQSVVPEKEKLSDPPEDDIEELPPESFEPLEDGALDLDVPVEEDEIDLELELDFSDEPLDLGADDEPAAGESGPQPAEDHAIIEGVNQEPGDLGLTALLEGDDQTSGSDAPEENLDPFEEEPERLPELEFDFDESWEAEGTREENTGKNRNADGFYRAAAEAPDFEKLDGFIRQGALDEAQTLAHQFAETYPGNPDVAARFNEIETLRAEAPVRTGAPEKKAGGLTEVERVRLDGEFSRFKKSVEAQVDQSDAETHFNLGIAYKEMGLLDDAVAEFDSAMRNPARLLDALTLKGICLREKTEFDAAEESFKSGLLLPDTSADEQCSLNYELGLLFEAWQKPGEALQYFARVSAFDPFYRDVAEKLKILQTELQSQEGGSDRPNSGKDRISYI